jgi:hypothetical protein
MTNTTPKTRAEARALRRAKASNVLRPGFRRWAYGVTAAAVGVAVFAGWLPPEASPVIAPLLMAVFFVDERGEPKPVSDAG